MKTELLCFFHLRKPEVSWFYVVFLLISFGEFNQLKPVDLSSEIKAFDWFLFIFGL